MCAMTGLLRGHWMDEPGGSSALRHGNIFAASKILDKMIDCNCKPVPDQLLDEQDRLEEMAITQMEDIRKFIMKVVMQWRKTLRADETYIETLKDQLVAQTLLDDIDAARAIHSLVAKPSTLPTPVYPLFPEQQSFNKTLTQQLSTKTISAMATCKLAKATAMDYCLLYEAVHAFEDITQSALNLSAKLSEIIQRLEMGVPLSNEDGSPLNLHLDDCLELTKHSKLQSVSAVASQLLQKVPVDLLHLDFSAVNPDCLSKGVTTIEQLKDCLAKAEQVHVDLVMHTERLKEASMSMQKHRWRQDVARNMAPLTPESPQNIPLSVNLSDKDFHQQIARLDTKFIKDIESPLDVLCQTLGQPLVESLHQTEQATSIIGVKAEVNVFQICIEDLRLQYKSAAQEYLSGQQIQWIETGARKPITLPSAVLLPFALHSLDDAVCHDCNSFTMRLNGDLHSLEQKAEPAVSCLAQSLTHKGPEFSVKQWPKFNCKEGAYILDNVYTLALTNFNPGMAMKRQPLCALRNDGNHNDVEKSSVNNGRILSYNHPTMKINFFTTVMMKMVFFLGQANSSCSMPMRWRIQGEILGC
ncbi:hypothetical protein F5146DRAFT_1209441 [Armillaria mellea]|nr:hypothetical protein F5146DRAFT_1209441 [Armillaria mellea]